LVIRFAHEHDATIVPARGVRTNRFAVSGRLALSSAEIANVYIAN
jgi:hypothetical protein